MKYVCDFSQVTSIGDQVCQSASDMASALNTYSSSISSDLSSWSGSAKSSFESSNNTHLQKSIAVANYVNSLGEFIKDASKCIETLEGELAALNI